MNALRPIVLAALIVTTCFGLARAAAPTITAGSATVNVGDTFDIPVSITNASDLQSFQFDLSFSPTIIRANSVTEGPFLSDACTTISPCTVFSPGVIDNATGHITLVSDAFVDLPPGPSGNGVLAEIEFHALAQGVSPLTLSNEFLDFSDSGFVTQNGLVTVLGAALTVPEPNALTLLSVGLAAWGARRWRARRGRGR